MSKVDSISFSYLLFTPYDLKEGSASLLKTSTPKDAPYFFDLDIDFLIKDSEKQEIDGVEVLLQSKIIDNSVLCWDCRYVLTNPFNQEGVEQNRKIRTAIKERLLGTPEDISKVIYEEYIAILIGDLKSEEKFVENNLIELASLIRYANKPLDKGQADQILSSRIKYSRKDLTIVDWEGAVVIAEDCDWESDIELFIVGNYQLIRYRMLDREIENSLKTVYGVVESKKKGWFVNQNSLIYEQVKQRLNLILIFEKIEQSLLLIGDWYSAQLYKIITDEFYIDDWKNTVKSKLDSLREIQDTVTQNLTFSWSRIVDQFQFWGWLILLIGYFVLFYLDIKAL